MNRHILLYSIFLCSCVIACDFPHQRIVRTAPHATLLVPYPRVGKRQNDERFLSPSASTQTVKRLFLARVGKRAFMYAARVGK
ncbi:unnamed protein product [Auanema sp. JU1783]|nr:unnamed protein product [Auanema sp. JU1783]